LRFAAWFLWITPFETALSSFFEAFAKAVSAAPLSAAAMARRVARTSVFSSLLTMRLRSRAFSLVLLRLICDLMFATLFRPSLIANRMLSVGGRGAAARRVQVWEPARKPRNKL